MKTLFFVFLFVSLSVFASERASNKTIKKHNKKTVHVEACGIGFPQTWVVSTYEDRQRGLMNHPPLTSKQAMLFVFEEEDHRSFWMKNVPYDLDIAFFDSNKKIVSITTMFGTSPMMKDDKLPSYPSNGPAQYALEAKAGTFNAVLKSSKLKSCKLSF